MPRALRGGERREVSGVAKNTGKDYREGAVRDRSQVQTPNGDWTKRNTETGQFMQGSDKPFKGVRKER